MLNIIEGAVKHEQHVTVHVTTKNKSVVTACYDCNNSIIKLYHDTPHPGHPGCFKTLELIKQDYWWPGMHLLVRKWIEGGATCQQMKINTHPSNPGLLLIKSNATRPFQQVTCNFITDLPPSNS
jgi:hypothetical protein